MATRNYPNDTDFRESFATAKLYGGDRASKGRLVLDRLEGSYGHKEVVQPDGISIEHIMPQTLTDWWKVHLGPDWELVHESHLNEVGNLTLTGYNPQLSNADYPKKCSILQGSHFELNKYFDDFQSWGSLSIRRRGERLAARALQIWPHLKPGESDIEATSISDLDSDVATDGYDLQFVLQHLGCPTFAPTNLRPVLYTISGGRSVTFKYSKLYPRRNHYWYGLRPQTLQELITADATHIVFVMGQYGTAAVSIETLQVFCLATGISHNPDGSVRHYHILVSNEEVPCLFWSSETPRISLHECFKPFDRPASSS